MIQECENIDIENINIEKVKDIKDIKSIRKNQVLSEYLIFCVQLKILM